MRIKHYNFGADLLGTDWTKIAGVAASGQKALIHNVVLVNADVAPVTFNIALFSYGETVDDAHAGYLNDLDVSVAANGCYVLRQQILLSAGMSVYAKASAAGVLSFKTNGRLELDIA